MAGSLTINVHQSQILRVTLLKYCVAHNLVEVELLSNSSLSLVIKHIIIPS